MIVADVVDVVVVAAAAAADNDDDNDNYQKLCSEWTKNAPVWLKDQLCGNQLKANSF